ncbi:MAG: cation:proton antiporter [Leptospiraceae bacterium]|nr:cation:proton antiporter [Leptospiraceae bacterium]
MHDLSFLKDLILISAVSIFITIIFQRFKIPSVIGMISTGILVGQSGFGLITDSKLILTLSELGVVILLFTIGLEFSIEELRKLKAIVFWGGSLQVLLTIAILGFFAYLLSPLVTSQISINKAIFYGIVFSVSSTPICLKILKDRGELSTSHGKIALGILIFQDIAIVPLMITINLLSPNESSSSSIVLKEIGFMLLFGASLVGGFKFLIPVFLKFISQTSAKEVWVFGALILCFGSAYISHMVGLSLALGAFLAGVIISGYDESHKIAHSIEPLRDALLGIFFMSLGLLIKINFELILHYLLVSFSVIMVKGAIISAIVLLLGFNTKISIMAGMVLAQVGEFSFVLASAALKNNLINDQNFQVILTSMVITMILAPAMISFAPHIASKAAPAFEFIPLQKFVNNQNVIHATTSVDNDCPEVIILGYGVIGKNVSSVLSAANIPYKVLELNLQAVKEARAKGVPIEYGDCTDWETLIKMHIELAKVVVISISDEKAVKEATSLIKKRLPHIFLIVRTRFLNNTEAITKLGADVVITEEFESSIQIFSAVLEKMGIDKEIILEQENFLRNNAKNLFPKQNA